MEEGIVEAAPAYAFSRPLDWLGFDPSYRKIPKLWEIYPKIVDGARDFAVFACRSARVHEVHKLTLIRWESDRVTRYRKQIRLLRQGEVKEALLRLPRHITCPFVFQKNGRHYSESYARKLWNRITSPMGIRISLYQGTRHSSITAAVERVGYDDVQEFVGHANRAMTKRYGRMNVKRLERVLRPKLPRG